MSPPPLKAVLDTNVLFPPLLRDVLLRAAEKGLYRPHWSKQILDELERVLVRVGELDAAKALRARTVLESAFPEALVENFDHLVPVMPNDPGDRHVAAAATLVGAEIIVTSNLKHFRKLPEGLVPKSPDVFLLHLFDRAPAAFVSILDEISADYKNPPQSIDALLTRLHAVAPRLRIALSKRLPTLEVDGDG